MRQVKRFRNLSRRQKNRRLKQLQISQNIVTIESNNSLNQKVKLIAKNSLLDKENFDDVSHFENNNNSNNCIRNISTNAVIEQSNVMSACTFSISPQRKHFLHSKKQISLREKLIL